MSESAAAITSPILATRPQKTPVAGALHTVVFLAVLFGSATLMYVSANGVRAVDPPNRIAFYVMTMGWEWLLMGYILFGVRRHGTPLSEVTGAQWKSAKEVFRDISIALVFWFVALLVLGLVARLVQFASMRQNVRLLAPEGPAEILLWTAVSTTAGICEETIFRGYLQKQFIAWTGNVSAGVLLSAAAFGIGHLYQGPKAIIVIGVYGLLFGILAQRRKSMRPGMITHALHDTVSGLAVRLLPR